MRMIKMSQGLGSSKPFRPLDPSALECTRGPNKILLGVYVYTGFVLSRKTYVTEGMTTTMTIICNDNYTDEKRPDQKHGKSQSRESVHTTLLLRIYIRPLEMWFDLLLLLVLFSGGFAGFFSVPVKLLISFLDGGVNYHDFGFQSLEAKFDL